MVAVRTRSDDAPPPDDIMDGVMPDVQSRPDTRGIDLEAVGVSKLRWPVTVRDRAGGTQSVPATIRLGVNVPKEYKGTHLSRFVEVMEYRRWGLSLNVIREVLTELKDTLDAESAYAVIEFPYFMMKQAPVSGIPAPMDYEAAFIGSVNGGEADLKLRVRVPVTSLCPCSRDISDYGAHNQRGFITITADYGAPNKFVWIEELIEIAEAAGSCPVFPVLKRVDEKWVTEHAYDNPVFVEDMVRTVARTMIDDGRFVAFTVEAENDESIHNHNAWARYVWAKEE